MDAAITAITGELTAADLWGVVASLAVFIGAMVIFSLGLHFVRKLTKGAAKGKVRF